MVATMSSESGIVRANGYTKEDGWEVTGIVLEERGNRPSDNLWSGQPP